MAFSLFPRKPTPWQTARLIVLLLVLGVVWWTFPLTGAEEPPPPQQQPTSIQSSGYQLDTVFQTNGVVWSFAFISPQELLATRRDGQLFYVNLADGTHKALPVPTPPDAPAVTADGQGGLLDVHFHRINGADYVYLTYSAETRVEGGGDFTTVLARGRWNGDTIEGIKTLLAAKIIGSGGRHFGSRLFFQGEHLFMTVGDRAERDAAQDLSYHNGKILRLDWDGNAAADNPFSHIADALPEIWSYGHRNPQGIDADAEGTIYSVEFGPRGGDELNLIAPEKNYGWPVITYGSEYWGPSIGTTEHPGMEQPVIYWVPSISPSGMAFYHGDKIPEWTGNLFLANLSAAHLRRLVLKDGQVTKEEVLFKELHERVRHVRSAPDGYLYFSTDSGKIVKVSLPQ